jgi:hypothetical protein
MNRNKLYSLITDAPQVGAQIKIVNSWEHEKAVAFHYELLDILEDIIKDYSKGDNPKCSMFKITMKVGANLIFPNFRKRALLGAYS